MVNYGYKCTGWTDQEKQELAKLLSELCSNYYEHHNGKRGCLQPYVEIDGLYEGVRIRRITWLLEKDVHELVDKADEIVIAMKEQIGK